MAPRISEEEPDIQEHGVGLLCSQVILAGTQRKS